MPPRIKPQPRKDISKEDFDRIELLPGEHVGSGPGGTSAAITQFGDDEEPLGIARRFDPAEPAIRGPGEGPKPQTITRTLPLDPNKNETLLSRIGSPAVAAPGTSAAKALFEGKTIRNAAKFGQGRVSSSDINPDTGRPYTDQERDDVNLASTFERTRRRTPGTQAQKSRAAFAELELTRARRNIGRQDFNDTLRQTALGLKAQEIKNTFDLGREQLATQEKVADAARTEKTVNEQDAIISDPKTTQAAKDKAEFDRAVALGNTEKADQLRAKKDTDDAISSNPVLKGAMDILETNIAELKTKQASGETFANFKGTISKQVGTAENTMKLFRGEAERRVNSKAQFESLSSADQAKVQSNQSRIDAELAKIANNDFNRFFKPREGIIRKLQAENDALLGDASVAPNLVAASGEAAAAASAPVPKGMVRVSVPGGNPKAPITSEHYNRIKADLPEDHTAEIGE